MKASERDAEYTEFVTSQRTPLVRMARLLTAGDEAYAEDLVQTTLTKIYVHWPKVRRAGNPVGYARTVLTNAFVDEQRRAHRRRETPHAPVDRLDERATVEEDRDLGRTVLAALDTLPARQRAVVVLRHWLDLDVAETARALGCTSGTVKSQNAKALARLRLTLDITLEEAK
jgi:RNA polymerase sigma-70 factor (sigma-E family)